jgi:signal transduction histidine kinase
VSDLNTIQRLSVAVDGLLAFLWAAIAHDAWRFLHAPRSRSLRMRTFPRLMVALPGALTALYVTSMVLRLTPSRLGGTLPGLHGVLWMIEGTLVVVAALLFRHVAEFFRIRDDSPGRRWLAVNYGSAVVVALVVVLSHLLLPHDPTRWYWRAHLILIRAYAVAVVAFTLLQASRFVGPGKWTATAQARRHDLVLGLVGVVCLGAFIPLLVYSRDASTSEATPLADLVANVILGFAFVTPFAVRLLGDVLRTVLTAATLLAATAGVYLCAERLLAQAGEPELRRLIHLGTIGALTLVLVGGHRWLGDVIDRLLFRRSRRRRAELQDLLQTLTPDVGTLECCRRALAGLVGVMELRGAGIILQDGQCITHGAFAAEPLVGVWPRGDAARVLPLEQFGALQRAHIPRPVREALAAAEVLAVMPIASPRRLWGHIFIHAGLVSAGFSEEDIQAAGGFAVQFALVLDGADLLARAVTVERSLAHAEKLAAIGELAARVAHEIRNPITAARSLAQQLARAPASTADAEATGLILTELERVERQVAALLRFARRETFSLEPVALRDLIEVTLDSFRPRFEAAGVRVTTELEAGIVVRADREKLRQTLINMIENALDAMPAGDAHLDLRTARDGGRAVLRIADNGAGIPADALGHIFEPFFSLKTTGTGLGLAIARRTIEAHGGTITAEGRAGGGTTFAITLPLEGR